MTQEAAKWRLLVFESVTSTSDLCRARAADGEPDGLAVLAGLQTAGRGSRGREWLSEPGNLALSLLIRPQTLAEHVGHWALLAGVAVSEALDRADIALKWPNDILLGHAKLGGILIDAATDGQGGVDWLVIGIGVNLRSAPAIAGRSLAALGDGTIPEALAERIMQRVTHWRAVQAEQGWAAIRSAWLCHALPLGCQMSLRQSDRRVLGAFHGLAEDGSLLLLVEGQVQSFSSGEIWLPEQSLETASC